MSSNQLMSLFLNRTHPLQRNAYLTSGLLNKDNEQLKLALERFSFECRKVIGFAFTTLHDWFRKLGLLFHPIRSKTKTNRDSLVRVFPRFASATCNYFVF